MSIFYLLFYMDCLHSGEFEEQLIMPIKILLLFITFWKGQIYIRVFERISYFMKLVLSSLSDVRELMYTYFLA